MAKLRRPDVQAYADANGITYTQAYDRLWHRKVGFKDADRVAALAARLDAVEPMEWARLAAFIDGEGSVTIQRSNGRHIYTAIQISNTDARLGVWLQSLFGGNISWVTPRNPKHRKALIWSVRSRHAEFVMRRIRPYMLLKGEQVDLALALRETIKIGRNQETAITDDEYARREDLMAQAKILNRRGNDVG